MPGFGPAAEVELLAASRSASLDLADADDVRADQLATLRQARRHQKSDRQFGQPAGVDLNEIERRKGS